jgi:hypothetical protein
MSQCPTQRAFQDAVLHLKDLANFVRNFEDDQAYLGYCEGVIESAIATLKIIAGDDKSV